MREAIKDILIILGGLLGTLRVGRGYSHFLILTFIRQEDLEDWVPYSRLKTINNLLKLQTNSILPKIKVNWKVPSPLPINPTYLLD